jgi:transposase
MSECRPAESSGLDTCRTLSFCPNPSRSRCAEWKCLPGRDGVGRGLRMRRRESYAGGETVSAVARRHGLTPQQLFGWRREARQRAESEAGEISRAFTPVIVEASRRHLDAPIAAARPDGSPMVEIVIGAATVRIPPGIDAVTLTTVLRAVRAAT